MKIKHNLIQKRQHLNKIQQELTIQHQSMEKIKTSKNSNQVKQNKTVLLLLKMIKRKIPFKNLNLKMTKRIIKYQIKKKIKKMKKKKVVKQIMLPQAIWLLNQSSKTLYLKMKITIIKARKIKIAVVKQRKVKRNLQLIFLWIYLVHLLIQEKQIKEHPNFKRVTINQKAIDKNQDKKLFLIRFHIIQRFFDTNQIKINNRMLIVLNQNTNELTKQLTNKQTNQPTNIQTNKQINKQTNKQTNYNHLPYLHEYMKKFDYKQKS